MRFFLARFHFATPASGSAAIQPKTYIPTSWHTTRHFSEATTAITVLLLLYIRYM
jgi:hypothetical protein